MSLSLPDIQRTRDTRRVHIARVGVTGIKLPIRVKRAPIEFTDLVQTLDTVGTFELSCSLPHYVKGTHMSRFTEVLNAHIDSGGVFSIGDLQAVALELGNRLESCNVNLKLSVDYFIIQNAPVSGRPGMAPVKGTLEVSVHRPAVGQAPYLIETKTGVVVEGKTCCPCSREISDYDHASGRGKGAHAQRSTVTIVADHQADAVVWFEQLIIAAQRSFSSPIYPVLKRPDERAVTVGAYENPKFVEDVIRDVAVELRKIDDIEAFTVRVQNAESIHYHDAFAEIHEDMSTDLSDMGEDEA